MVEPRQRPITVLVVEDEPAVRFVATEGLRDDGFQVLEAETGAQALAVVEQGATFDVLFTDVNMPGSPDGIALAEQVCRRRPEIKVIVASGRPLPTFPLPCEGKFVPKPYRMHQISRLVADMVGLR